MIIDEKSFAKLKPAEQKAVLYALMLFENYGEPNSGEQLKKSLHKNLYKYLGHEEKEIVTEDLIDSVIKEKPSLTLYKAVSEFHSGRIEDIFAGKEKSYITEENPIFPHEFAYNESNTALSDEDGEIKKQQQKAISNTDNMNVTGSNAIALNEKSLPKKVSRLKNNAEKNDGQTKYILKSDSQTEVLFAENDENNEYMIYQTPKEVFEKKKGGDSELAGFQTPKKIFEKEKGGGSVNAGFQTPKKIFEKEKGGGSVDKGFQPSKGISKNENEIKNSIKTKDDLNVEYNAVSMREQLKKLYENNIFDYNSIKTQDSDINSAVLFYSENQSDRKTAHSQITTQYTLYNENSGDKYSPPSGLALDLKPEGSPLSKTAAEPARETVTSVVLHSTLTEFKETEIIPLITDKIGKDDMMSLLAEQLAKQASATTPSPYGRYIR